jgi:hypothetical protein
MTAVTAALSGKVDGTSLNGISPGPVRTRGGKKLAPLPEAARRALAHGSLVLERVFGIRSASGSDKPE